MWSRFTAKFTEHLKLERPGSFRFLQPFHPMCPDGPWTLGAGGVIEMSQPSWVQHSTISYGSLLFNLMTSSLSGVLCVCVFVREERGGERKPKWLHCTALSHEPGPTLDPCVLLGERTLTSQGTKTKRGEEYSWKNCPMNQQNGMCLLGQC